MKKEYLPLIGSAFGVIVLGSALASILLSEKPPEQPQSSSEIREQAIIDKNNYDLVKITLTTRSGKFSILHTGGLNFTIEELGDVPLDNDMLLKAANAASSIIASRIVSQSASDWDQYGLESPTAIIQVSHIDPEAVTLLLGDRAPGDAGRYVAVQGGENVYLADNDAADPLLTPMPDYISAVVTAFPGYDERITRLELSGGPRDEPIVLEPAYSLPQGSGESSAPQQGQPWISGYSLLSPGERQESFGKGIDIINSIFGITADSVTDYLPDEAAMAARGLASPYAKISAALSTGESITLISSKPGADGSCYVMREGAPVIYRAQSAPLLWMDALYRDFISPDMITSPAGDVKTLSFTRGEDVFVFRLTHSEGGMSVDLYGQDIPARDFLPLYEKLKAITGEEYTSERPDKDAQALISARVSYTGADKTTDTLTIYPGPARRVFVSFNGDISFLCRSSAADALLDALSSLTGS